MGRQSLRWRPAHPRATNPIGVPPMITPYPIDDIFTPSECQTIISTALSAPAAQGALVGGQTASNIRRSDTYWLDDVTDGAWVFHRLLETIAAANREHFHFELDAFQERMQVARYSATQAGFFDWHTDCGAGPLASRRKLTIVVQLSEDLSYDGGLLQMNADGHVVAASRAIGSGIVIPSFVLHHVSHVTRSERYSMTLWAHGPAFR